MKIFMQCPQNYYFNKSQVISMIKDPYLIIT